MSMSKAWIIPAPKPLNSFADSKKTDGDEEAEEDEDEEEGDEEEEEVSVYNVGQTMRD